MGTDGEMGTGVPACQNFAEKASERGGESHTGAAVGCFVEDSTDENATSWGLGDEGEALVPVRECSQKEEQGEAQRQIGRQLRDRVQEESKCPDTFRIHLEQFRVSRVEFLSRESWCAFLCLFLLL